MNPNSPAAADSKSPVVTWLVIAACFVAALVWLLFLKPQVISQRATGHPAVGQPLMVLDLQPLTGDSAPLTVADLRGKVSLINFWGPWCYFCKLEFPHLLELWDRYRAQPDFALISISSESHPGDSVDEVRAETAQYLQSQGTALPTYIDATGTTRRILAEQLGGEFGYPTTLLVDRAGIIRAVWIGYERGYEQQMEQLVSKLLAEK